MVYGTGEGRLGIVLSDGDRVSNTNGDVLGGGLRELGKARGMSCFSSGIEY